MALMASSLLNGERVIVLLLITRILFSTPFSLLLFEAVALSLLAATALIAEIYVECSSPCKFSTRPGASSGILLGAVTLPAVMFSKMVQLSRGLLLEEVALAVFQYQRLLYWATYIYAASVCFCSLTWSFGIQAAASFF